jgi:ubiquinone/menaquinone biosynthesis C-methylase UbiE
MKTVDEVEKQRSYYAEMAAKYNEAHINDNDAHALALHVFSAFTKFENAQSILDVGAGTGRGVNFMIKNAPHLKRITGIEPSEALCKVGHNNGIQSHQLITGDGQNLPFADNEFDFAMCTGVLHHTRHPEKILMEMLRVSRMGICISDSNRFGQGSMWARWFKRTLYSLGLWKVFDWLRTNGKGYHESDGDGIFYSFSVFDHCPFLRKFCRKIHFLNTTRGEHNLRNSAEGIAVIALK